MNSQRQVGDVVAVGDQDGKDAAVMEAFLRAQGATEAPWYLPSDLNDVDRAVCEGRVRRVVFDSLSTLLEGVWNGDIEFSRWLATGTQVDFAEPPGQSTCAHVQAVFESWEQWQRRRRRRQVTAGVILSVVALVAAFVLNWLPM